MAEWNTRNRLSAKFFTASSPRLTFLTLPSRAHAHVRFHPLTRGTTEQRLKSVGLLRKIAKINNAAVPRSRCTFFWRSKNFHNFPLSIRSRFSVKEGARQLGRKSLNVTLNNRSMEHGLILEIT